MKLDLGTAPVPEKIFCAQLLRIDRTSDLTLISFAQVVPPRRIISAVMIQMTVSAFKEFMKTFNDHFRETVRKVENDPTLVLTEAERSTVPPERIFCFQANTGRVTVTSFGVDFDWMQAPGHSLRTSSGSVAVIPVVCVSTGPSLLTAFTEESDTFLRGVGE